MLVVDRNLGRKSVAAILSCLLLALFLSEPLKVAAETEPVEIHAEAAAVIDVHSGRILYSKEGDKPLPIASLTKVMTAIVAIESGDLSDQVRVGRQAYGKEGSSIYLRLGETMNLEHLLYGLMLRSGNDAAVAIAEHVGGSIEGFAYLMNEKAMMLGMENSNFQNPHGLDEKGHVSTANDLAKLTAYALKNPVFQNIVKTKVKIVPNPNEKWGYKWLNKNKMLYMYDGADGVKTGYTRIAGRCLISSATRDGRQIAVVTLNDPNDWADHKKLLDYGFNQFAEEEIIEKGESFGSEALRAAHSFRYPLRADETEKVEKKISFYQPDSISYRLGEIGRVDIYLAGELIGSVPLNDPQAVAGSEKEHQAFRGKKANTGYASVLQTVLKQLFSVISGN